MDVFVLWMFLYRNFIGFYIRYLYIDTVIS